jgi:hypothetical protein
LTIKLSPNGTLGSESVRGEIASCAYTVAVRLRQRLTLTRESMLALIPFSAGLVLTTFGGAVEIGATQHQLKGLVLK